MKENLIEKILLFVIVVLLINSTFQQCQIKNEQTRLVKQQLAVSDSTKKQINRIIATRRDSIIKENNYIRDVIKWKERANNEVIQTNNVDSLIILYWRNRPNKIN